MAKLKLTDITRGAALLKKAIDKADLNADGAVRTSDLEKLRQHLQTPQNSRGNWWTKDDDASRLYYAVRGAAEFATRLSGSREVRDVKAAVEELKTRARAADTDGDGFLEDAEVKKLRNVSDKSFLAFVAAYKGRTSADLDFPEVKPARAPRFDWKGTPAEVTQSLLDACSKRSNDNFWPGNGKPSRYNLGVDEAKAMVDALQPLYRNRQQAVLRELARRSSSSDFGCVAPTDAAAKVLQTLATSLGLTLTFGQPAAPTFDPW
ncbi:MAG: hypothetical protein K1X89_05540 [Myxococcaceae bacterium]|nr:hypothetical protein [Myxococcaceae bacterium]